MNRASNPVVNAFLKVMLLATAMMPLTAASPISIPTEHTTSMPVIAIASVAISLKKFYCKIIPFLLSSEEYSSNIRKVFGKLFIFRCLGRILLKFAVNSNKISIKNHPYKPLKCHFGCDKRVHFR
jgi:hypothetical protein